MLDRPLEEGAAYTNSQQQMMNGRPSSRPWQLGTRLEVEILCNNQVDVSRTESLVKKVNLCAYYAFFRCAENRISYLLKKK